MWRSINDLVIRSEKTYSEFRKERCATPPWLGAKTLVNQLFVDTEEYSKKLWRVVMFSLSARSEWLQECAFVKLDLILCAAFCANFFLASMVIPSLSWLFNLYGNPEPCRAQLIESGSFVGYSVQVPLFRFKAAGHCWLSFGRGLEQIQFGKIP